MTDPAIHDAANAFARGALVLVIDAVAEDALGMLALPADHVNAKRRHGLGRTGGGSTYLALTADRCDQLGLDHVAADRDDVGHPPATVSITGGRWRHPWHGRC